MFGHNAHEVYKTFSASTVDSTLVNNYDPANYALFIGDTIQDDGSQNRDDGTIQHSYDKGFKIIAHDDATTPQEIILTSISSPTSNQSFTLESGDELHREGMDNKVFHITSDGTETITELPWLRSGSYAIGIGTSPDQSGDVVENEEESLLPEDEITDESAPVSEEITILGMTHKKSPVVGVLVALVFGGVLYKYLSWRRIRKAGQTQ